VSLLHAHLVFVTNYRRPVSTDQMLTFCQRTMHAVCAELDVELVEVNGEADHVHLLVAYPPTLAICALVQRLKGRTAYAVRREYTGAGVRARMRGHLWSPSYFAVSWEAHRCRSSTNTSTAKTGQSKRRAPPGDKTGWTNPAKARGLRPRSSGQRR
jgi:putative transposase